MPTIEHFLARRVAREYALQNYHFGRASIELYASSQRLYDLYSSQIPEIDRLRKNLADALSSEPSEQKALAERWSSFLKARATGMEYWSSLSSVFMTLFGVAGTLFALIASATGVAQPYFYLVVMLAMTLVFLHLKNRADERAFWFKFVSGQLEAISKFGA
jgi:hypothetical protein